MAKQEVRYELQDHILTLTLDRPDARNAWSETMVREYLAALTRAEADEDVHVVILTGAGDAFSAGGDIKAMQEKSGMFAGDPAELRARYKTGLQQVTLAMQRFSKPIVAAINGPAIGAGLDLACMCDLRIASSRAKFGSTFVALGLIPGDGGAWLLQRVVGRARALELVMTGRVIRAQDAERIGLIHEFVEPEFVMARAREVAEEIAQHPPLAVQLARALAYKAEDMTLSDSLDLAATYQGIVQNRPEHFDRLEALVARLKK